MVNEKEGIDETLKEEIKTHRKGKPGNVMGEIFKAHLSKVPTTRLDQKLLQEKYPKAWTACQVTTSQSRITFEPR